MAGRALYFSLWPHVQLPCRPQRVGVINRTCLAPRPHADSQVSERQITHFPSVGSQAALPQGNGPELLLGSRELAGLQQHNQICHSLRELASFLGLVPCSGGNNCRFPLVFLLW